MEHGLDRISQDSFYLAQPNNGSTAIPRISPDEYSRYKEAVGLVSSEPEFVFVSSGGSAKAWWTAGLLQVLHGNIIIDKYVMTSASALMSVIEVLDSKGYEEFALEIPELIEPKLSKYARHSEFLRKWEMGRNYRSSRTVNLHGCEEIETPVGIYSTEKLEARLKEIFKEGSMETALPKFIIMAAMYDKLDSNGRPTPIAIGKYYPEMPVHTAIPAAIAMKHLIAFQVYANHLIGDAGHVHNFPLLKEHIGDSSTVVGVDLGYRNGDSLESKLPRDLREKAIADQAYNNDTTERLLRELTGKSPGEGGEQHRVLYIAPRISGVGTYKIHLTPQEIRWLMAEGRKAGELVLRQFRHPTFAVSGYPTSQAA